MGVFYNPRIPTEGLLFHLDAANTRSLGGFGPSLVSDDTWTIGNDSVGIFGRNGTVEMQNRKIATGPFGYPLVVWECVPDAASSSDGGWNTSSFSINNAYTYRFSVWARRTVIGNGTFYLGLNGFGSVDGVYNRSDGSNNTNPYFWTASGATISDWRLVVGHVWPAGSGTGAIHTDSGYYSIASGKLGVTNDFVWRSETVNTRHRSYLYYSTDTATRQEMAMPRVDKCDGTEPSISDLLNNSPYKWRDMTNNGYHANPSGNQTKRTLASTGIVYTPGAVADGIAATNDDGFCFVVPHVAALNPGSMPGWTVSGWVKTSADQDGNGIGWFHKGDQRIHIEHQNDDIRVSTFTSWTSHLDTISSYYGAYVHVTVTYNQTSGTYGTNAGETKVYLNGILSSTNSSNIPVVDNSSNINLGRRGGHLYRFLNGTVCTYMFYNRAITANEVFTIYSATRKRYQ